MERFENLVSFFYHRCNRFSDNVFIKNYDGTTYTYREIKDIVAKTSHFLKRYNIEKEDKVSIILPNYPEYIPLLMGVLSHGGVAVNLNINFTNLEFKTRFTDADVSMIITTPAIYERIKDVSAELAIKRTVLVEPGAIFDADLGMYSMGIATAAYSTVPLLPEFDHSKIGFLQYTGGTTGGIKAAMLSHGNILANIHQIRKHFGDKLSEHEEVMPASFPLYHVFALTFNIFTFFNVGATCLMYPVTKDLPQLIKIIKENKITFFVGVNTLYKLLMQSAQLHKADFSGIKVCIGGGEHIMLTTKLEWQETFGIPIYEAYGLTETSAMAIVNPINAENDLETIGRPIPDTEVLLLDEEDNPVTEDNIHGEILLKGPQVIERYWNKPQENLNSFKDGWFRTGDIAVWKNGSYLKIVDRKKDMISVSGFKVFPNEVEAVVATFEGINDCAVVGEKDAQTGERVVLYYVAEKPVDQEALTIYCKQYLTAFKVPKKIIKVELIPKTAIGKTMRSSLRKLQESNG